MMKEASEIFYSRGRLCRTKLATAVGALMLCSTLTSLAAGSWPQWRGPQGQGISQESGLPDQWHDGAENIRWKVPIPGHGISSPIAHEGKVFVTTAYPGSERVVAGTLAKWGIVGAACLALITLCWRLATCRRGRESDEPSWMARTRLLDSPAFVLTTLVFLAAAVAAVIRPSEFAELTWKFLPGSLEWQPGQPGPTWLVSGFLAAAGLAVAVGWAPFGSFWRVLGAVCLLLVVVPFAKFAPVGLWGGEYALWKKIVFASPAWIAAGWFVVSFLGSRKLRTAGLGFPAAATALLLLSVACLLFASLNIWQPRLGLQRVVMAVDLENGEILWETPVFMAPEEQRYPTSSSATPTPCTDGKYVFAHFGSGYACLDTSGNRLWHEVDEEFTRSTRYGAGSSPVMTDDKFIVAQESESFDPGDGFRVYRPSYIVAINKETGEEAWRIHPSKAHDSYSTPIVRQRGESTELITPSWEWLLAYDVDSGEELWSQPIPIQQVVPSMVTAENRLFIAGGTHGPKAIMAADLIGEGSETSVETVWDCNTGIPETPSPVLYRDKLFVVTDKGILACYDPETGDLLRKRRIGGKCYASLVAGDGKLYVCDTGGTTTVVSADARLKVLAKNELGEDVYASPALTDGCIVIRSTEHLFCIEGQPASSSDSSIGASD